MIEVLVALAILAVLGMLIYSSLGPIRSGTEKIRCTNNLKGLGRAALLFAAENNNNLVPLRQDATGLWYDHLHEYVERESGRAGRYVNGVKVNYPGFNCPLLGQRYLINRICGHQAEVKSYLKMGQGLDKGKVVALPGGLSKTAWFTDPQKAEGGESFSPENYAEGNPNFPGFPHNKSGNALFMDGHVENIMNPNFTSNPSKLDRDEWIRFFGRKR